jgi:glyoxylase I family protein
VVPITTDSVAHIRLTVTDIARSRAFYDAVFGWPVLLEVPPDADHATRAELAFLYGGVIYRAANSLIGLRPVGSDRFDEDRVGLDHLAFAVADREKLTAAARLLDDLGVPHHGVKDIGASYILEFRDPDNIALEFVASKAWLDSSR